MARAPRFTLYAAPYSRAQDTCQSGYRRRYLNNRAVLRGRPRFEGHKELERKRAMLRLWLAMPDWPELPRHMKRH